jgi:hypothetical protein
MTFTSRFAETISTVPLSPFNEGQWHRLMACPSIVYSNSHDLNNHRTKSSKDRLPVVNTINTDNRLYNETQRRTIAAVMPTLLKINPRQHQTSIECIDSEPKRRTTSPIDEYDRTTDVFYQTREPSILNETSNDSKFVSHSQVLIIKTIDRVEKPTRTRLDCCTAEYTYGTKKAFVSCCTRVSVRNIIECSMSSDVANA